MSATARPEAPVVSYDGPVVAVRHVDLDRDGQEVLRDINFVVEKGQILGVVGPNGGGKTSLLRLVLGLERPTRGEIELFGQPVARFRGWNRIGYIPQHAVGFDQNFPASVREIVLLGRVARRGLLRWLGTDDRNAARRAIELCGLIGLEGRRVGALSGGEKQRVFIAKAIAAEPDLLVMDEPTAGVDPESERRFYDLLGRFELLPHLWSGLRLARSRGRERPGGPRGVREPHPRVRRPSACAAGRGTVAPAVRGRHGDDRA